MNNTIASYAFRLQSLLREVKNILIVVKSTPDNDYVASGIALYLSLLQRGKQVQIASPDKITVAQSDLIGIDKITSDLGKGGRNLVISFPYVENKVEKVSYTIENNGFNLVIAPTTDPERLNKDLVEFTRSGEGAVSFDLIIAVGIASYEELGKFNATHRKLFTQKTTVVISNKQVTQNEFGKLHIVNPSSASVSEIVAILLSRMNYPMDVDICNNLLKGIKEKTNNFTQGATADTFEAAAACMRKSTAGIEEPRFSPSFERNPQSFMPPSNQAGPFNENQKTPPDWLKPKIYRSGNQNQNILNNQNKGSIL